MPPGAAETGAVGVNSTEGLQYEAGHLLEVMRYECKSATLGNSSATAAQRKAAEAEVEAGHGSGSRARCRRSQAAALLRTGSRCQTCKVRKRGREIRLCQTETPALF